MNQYVATFHTHVSALISFRTLTGRGVSARMAPVPRRLSSSCGTCVFYEADGPLLDAMDQDVEQVCRIDGEQSYTTLFHNE